MIARLTGRVVELAATSAVLDVGGVGLSVICPPTTLTGLRLDQVGQLWTQLVVREDALTLYGFASPAERQVFQIVQSVSGIGPRIALGLVATLSPAELRQAVMTGNLVALTKVPGVGQKVAQRLVIELKDKVATLADDDIVAGDTASGVRDQVIEGLRNLGYSAREADAAWDKIEPPATDPSLDLAALMRAALRSLARG